MLKINKEKRIAKKIREKLQKKGFIIKTIYSKKTKSVYLKIDNGACPSIRISDHKNYKTKCKFNVIYNYNGKRTELYNGTIKIFYNFKSLSILIADLEIERSNKILRYGYTKYKEIRDKNSLSNNYAYGKVA